jgi:TolB protein
MPLPPPPIPHPTDQQPGWSPDNNWIAFVSDRSGHNEIWLVHPNGTGLTQLTSSAAISQQPSWAADSQGVIFSSNRDGGYELYYQRISGGAAVRLTVSGGDNTQPASTGR